MIIGVDYTAAVWQGAGIGRYTRELIQTTIALSESSRHVRFVLLYAAGGLPTNSPYVRHLHALCHAYPHVVRAVPIPLTPRLLTIVWQRLRLPLYAELFTGKLDVLHAPDFVLPPTHARTLLTVHDLTFLTNPNCFEPQLQRYLARVVPRSIRNATLIVADSHATRADLHRLLNVSLNKSVVIYPGVDHQRFCPLDNNVTEPIRKRLGIPHPYVLFVGTLEPRKNIVRLIEAFTCIIDAANNAPYDALAHHTLVIAGRKGWLYEDIFRAVEHHALESRVHFLDFVQDDDLPALYNEADVFVYPSLYEGFGLPVAEALACGTPVVTSHVASLPEVAGNAAILVNPHDSAAIATGIATAYAERHRLRQAGTQHARRFLWKQSAYALMATYMHVTQQ